jgi:hypothetical protein
MYCIRWAASVEIINPESTLLLNLNIKIFAKIKLKNKKNGIPSTHKIAIGDVGKINKSFNSNEKSFI